MFLVPLVHAPWRVRATGATARQRPIRPFCSPLGRICGAEAQAAAGPPRGGVCQPKRMRDSSDSALRLRLQQAVTARLDEVVVRIDDMLVRDLEGYADVPPAERRADVRESLLGVLRGLSQDAAAGEAQRRWASDVARRRAAEGVPVEAVVAAYAEGNRMLWDVVLKEAHRLSTPHPLLLQLTLERWAQNDHVQGAVVQAHREEDLIRVRRRELRRQALVRRLLLPSLEEPAATPEDIAEALRLPAGRPLYCVRARGLPSRDVQQLCTAALLEDLDGEPVALSIATPRSPTQGVLGYDGPCELADLPQAYAAADRAAAVASRAGLTGAFTLVDVALEAVVVDERDLGDKLAERYVRPLRGMTTRSDVLDTLWQFLSLGRNVDRAAAALFVHPNTVRSRIARYEELAHADLRDGPTAVRVAWTLAHHRRAGVDTT
jgi:hypothetical protein